MAKIVDKSVNFLKNQTILSISLILAIISTFFVKPSINYLDYINYETIILLFVIMVIVEVLKNLAVFEILLRKILRKIKDTRGLVLVMVGICFISSVFITNDVSLIIFVAFAVMALKMVKREDLVIMTVSLQTIAANVGCMILPIGAPHNIVLYTASGMSFESFFYILLPYVVVSVIFLGVIMFFIPVDDIVLPVMGEVVVDKKNFLRRVFVGVDYYLLLTFIALFVLIGNLGCMPVFSLFVKKLIVGNEVLCGVLLSQVISNVPSAMLLTGFSSNYVPIIVGVNIGGFGTLIASMANLISYNIISRECAGYKRGYLLLFTLLNVLLLVLLLLVYFLL